MGEKGEQKREERGEGERALAMVVSGEGWPNIVVVLDLDGCGVGRRGVVALRAEGWVNQVPVEALQWQR